ncbi:accessory Sec system translocase SecA2 [Granulicatella sp. zg-ZJ]|uniref:accessory Sec system translocase SecA2 n=1 Tax=Granulicatella sp. zg-ZJ TaxID=2678504 RepID=UPI0013D176B6|nr:accessory Sec system translocase SecA2 [Granulicatella sp. zg-ZJ]NEW63221.1 accessory Sec system translocase SecA2 [Granulicatella sp. zg-ZJ]
MKNPNGLFSLNRLRLNRIKRILKQVNQFADYMASLSDEQLQHQTVLFKERLVNGETLDDLLPEAFAAIREADKRILGMFPYDVQVMGGIVLHQGNIAEMKTGEGKTLTATMPLYLNALAGKPVMLVTNNGYLALRDKEEMGPVYEFMGLSVSTPVSKDDDEMVKATEKQVFYKADIIYTTNGSLGFDYLGDNLVDSKNKKYMCPLSYAIIDEIDAVLLDSAQTPLVISGSPKVQSNLYTMTNEFILTLVENEDYKCDEDRSNVWLTRKGIQEAEKFFGLKNIYTKENFQLVRNIVLALRANTLLERDEDYAVWKGKVTLLDKTTGRLLHGMKLGSGQHQALEAKERVELSADTKTMASITFQNLFKMFDKLAGMSGTAKVDESEFIETYGMSVVVIPTNRKSIRKDLPDSVYRNLPDKLYASLDYVKKIHATGQPVLVAVGSVDMSELYSELLLREGIPHSVLNAYNAAKEALMIKEAGQIGAVTVATAMAGRGTDIKLGEGVAQLGGLAVIGTERMSSKRTDLQLRGRSGRQGDPGVTKFFVSLEDDVVVKYGPKWVEKYYLEGEQKLPVKMPKALKGFKFIRLVNEAQLSSDSKGRASRETTQQFDESIQIQRQILYRARDELLLKDDKLAVNLKEIAQEVVQRFLQQYETYTKEDIMRFILDNINYRFTDTDVLDKVTSKDDLGNFLIKSFLTEIARKRAVLKDDHKFFIFQKIAILKAVDECWIDQIDNLQLLKTAVAGRRSAQKNPIYEYHHEALLTYRLMQEAIKDNMMRYLALSYVRQEDDDVIVYFP